MPMNTPNEQLLEYIRIRTNEGANPSQIRNILLQNEWTNSVIDEAFSILGITTNNDTSLDIEPLAVDTQNNSSFATTSLTMDKIIEKFIPIVGALLLIVGFGYLIYANAWVNLGMEVRLTLGFFCSVAIIGASFSFSDKMRYFADIGIGSGILLLYATLIYGSRTTDLAVAMIPEVVTLFTAVLFTITIAYFASKRNSKVILILGMLGAYITPFVIGQNDVWANNISFNAYMLYFLAINISVFLIGKEISVRNIIPLNLIGLFVGVSTLWGLSNTNNINAIAVDNFFSGEVFTAILFMVLVVFSIWSILVSARQFSEKDDGYLSLGYVAPIVWFAFNVESLNTITDALVGTLYAIIATACFAGWYELRNTQTRFQHTALYAAGLVSGALAIFAFFEEFNVVTSMLIAYTSLVFAFLFVAESAKAERFVSYMLVSFLGSVLSIHHITSANLQFETPLIVVALLPAILTYFVAKQDEKQEFTAIAAIYSVFWSIVATGFVVSEFIEYLDVEFFLFYILPLCLLTYIALVNIMSPNKMSHDSRSKFLQFTMVGFAFGFITTFFILVVSLYPAPTDTSLFGGNNLGTDWIMIKGIFATAILFIGLWISRQLQSEQVIKRPSFILVIFGFTTLLLTGNYMIAALMNDLGVPHIDGGPRAVVTTIWWLLIAVFMLYKGIKYGKKYHSEKLLGLMLLGITVIKILLYDIVTMNMQNKIIVLMIVGGGMLLFSYRVRSKGLITETN